MDYTGLLGQVAPQTIQQAQSQQLQQQLQAAQQQQVQAQTQTAQQDLADKRRALGASMFNGVMMEPDPAKQQALIQKLVPIYNKYVPDMQLDPEATDLSTVKSIQQAQIPVQSLPAYQMQQQNIALMQALRNRLAPDPSTPPMGLSGQPTAPGSTQAVPTATQSPLSSSDMALMAMVKPDMADALVKQGELALKQNPGPQAEQTKTAENAAEAGKTLNVMNANLPVVLQRFKEMNDAAKNASYGLGVQEDGEGTKQMFHKQFDSTLGLPEAQANTILQQRAAQGILPELGPQLAQAGIRGNKFLETIASSASGLDLAADPAAKQAAINGLKEQYVNNLKSTARQVRAYGGQAPTDADIDAAVAKYEAPAPNASSQAQAMLKQSTVPVVKGPTDPAFAALPSGTQFKTIGADGQIITMVKH